jgi:hypothetical protein
MSTRTRRSVEVRVPASRNDARPAWPTEVGQLLEEHHLAAWSHHRAEQERFASTLGEALAGIPDTEVIVLHGSRIRDLSSLGEQLGAVGDGDDGPLTIDGPGGLIAWLRRRPGEGAASAVKRRYYLWRDADTLLRHDPALFGRVVDAIAGVAAEAEYASEDLLLIHRAIFVGGPALDVYAEDERGQFRSWLREDGERPLWEVVSGLMRPPVLPYRIEASD